MRRREREIERDRVKFVLINTFIVYAASRHLTCPASQPRADADPVTVDDGKVS